MRGWWITAIVLTIVIPAAHRTALADAAGSTVWKSDFPAAEAEARRRDVPLLLHFYGTWCGPCKQMDKETLYTGDLIRTLDGKFVAVKVNIKLAPELQRRFGVKVLPTDVVVSPEGRVISFHEGYASKADYMTFVTRADQKFLAAKPKKTPASVAGTGSQPPSVVQNGVRALVNEPETITRTDKLPPDPMDLPTEIPSEQPAADAVAALTNDPANNADEIPETPVEGQPLIPETGEVELAMDGFCPVTLRKTRVWQAGQKAHAYHYQDQVYLFRGEAELKEFKQDPARYAPSLMGCDPVTLTDSRLAIQGTTKYGAYFDGRLFLFENAANRTRFKQEPQKYIRVQQALTIDDIKKRRV